MFRNGRSSPASQNIRHRYQAWKEDQRRNGSLSGGDTPSSGLDLSIHMPSRTSGNRFDVLRPQSPPPKPHRDPLDDLYYPRIRHSRGSKEAKRRRDARRNRRKLQAVQALDEQLSRDIEKTLSQATLPKPQRSALPSPAAIQPSVSTPAPPPPVYVTHTPPKLPYFNFGGLDLIGDYPPLTPDKVDSGYWSSSPLTPTLPTWCSEIPPFTNKNFKWSEFPLVFDLSKLPEPAHKPQPGLSSREVQLWRPQPTPPPPPKKQSRFFPSNPSSKPTIKLPPTGCKLHADDKGLKTPSSKPRTVAESLEQVVKAAETARKIKSDEESKKNAANLWKILTSSEEPVSGDDNGPYSRNVSYQPLDDMHVAPFGLYDHRLETVGMPFEPNSTDLPYVHANSLTGHANERGSEPFPTPEEDVTLCEAPTYPANFEDFLGGLNELVMDPYTDDGYTEALLATINLPPLPPSPDLEHTAPLRTDPPRVDSVIMASRATQTDLETSDAHFKSEQALFHPQPLTARTPEDDLVDVATFLKMGHVDNCWCNDCGEPPALLGGETLVEDDGWMIYSSADEQTWSSWSDTATPSNDSVSA